MEIRYNLKKAHVASITLFVFAVVLFVFCVVYTFMTKYLLMLIPDFLFFALGVACVIEFLYANKEMVINSNYIIKVLYHKQYKYKFSDVAYAKIYKTFEYGGKSCVLVLKDNSGILIQTGYMTVEQVETFKKILQINNVEIRYMDEQDKKKNKKAK